MTQNHLCHIRIYIRVQFQGIEPNKAGQDSVINNKNQTKAPTTDIEGWQSYIKDQFRLNHVTCIQNHEAMQAKSFAQ